MGPLRVAASSSAPQIGQKRKMNEDDDAAGEASLSKRSRVAAEPIAEEDEPEPAPAPDAAPRETRPLPTREPTIVREVREGVAEVDLDEHPVKEDATEAPAQQKTDEKDEAAVSDAPATEEVEVPAAVPAEDASPEVPIEEPKVSAPSDEAAAIDVAPEKSAPAEAPAKPLAASPIQNLPTGTPKKKRAPRKRVDASEAVEPSSQTVDAEASSEGPAPKAAAV